MKKFTEKAQDYFERHPSSEECHITSDGRVFHTKGSALGFAGTLDNQDVESYTRKGLEKETDLTEFDSPAGQIALDVFLASNEVENLKYNDLKALVKHFKIETEDQKAETLITALTEFKINLNQD